MDDLLKEILSKWLYSRDTVEKLLGKILETVEEPMNFINSEFEVEEGSLQDNLIEVINNGDYEFSMCYKSVLIYDKNKNTHEYKEPVIIGINKGKFLCSYRDDPSVIVEYGDELSFNSFEDKIEILNSINKCIGNKIIILNI